MVPVIGIAIQATGTANLTIDMASLATGIGILASGFAIPAGVSARLFKGTTTRPSRSRRGLEVWRCSRSRWRRFTGGTSSGQLILRSVHQTGRSASNRSRPVAFRPLIVARMSLPPGRKVPTLALPLLRAPRPLSPCAEGPCTQFARC